MEQFISFTNTTTFLIPIILLSLLIFVFLLPVMSGEKLTFFRRGKWGFLLNNRFYRIPLLWLSLFGISFLAIFRSNEKIYLKEAIRGDFSYFNYSSEFDKTIIKEPNYYYALFVANVVTYFQQIRYHLNRRHTGRNIYPGVNGALTIHHEAATLSTHHLERLEQILFDNGNWIPFEKRNKYETKEKQRLISFQDSLEREKVIQLKAKLKELDDASIDIVRSVTKKKTKRFDSMQEKGID